MIQLENTKVYGWEAAIRGARNPMNSWEKSDTWFLSSIEDGCNYYHQMRIPTKNGLVYHSSDNEEDRAIYEQRLQTNGNYITILMGTND